MGGNRYPRRLQVSRKIAMSNNNLTLSDRSAIRAKSFKVTSHTQNFAQYVATVKAYALAGMPFEHIANAGDFLGDQVERGEIDAPILEGWQEKAGEVAEDKSKILSWQNRGEIISIMPQISSASITNQELIPISQQLSTTQNPDQTINVVEGIAVFNQKTSGQLENNPYLSAPADLKKST